jgi:hypothetical protein
VAPLKFLGALFLLIGLFANSWILVKSGDVARAHGAASKAGWITVRERVLWMSRMWGLAQRGEFSTLWLVVAAMAPLVGIVLYSVR